MNNIQQLLQQLNFTPEKAVDLLLPPAVEWLTQQENRIRTHGKELPFPICQYARELGVQNPEQVIVMQEEHIPLPFDPFLQSMLQLTGILSPDTAGITMNYGIYLTTSGIKDPKILIHELVHVGQYERLKGIEGFLRKYIREIIDYGYEQSPLELEASQLADKFMQGVNK